MNVVEEVCKHCEIANYRGRCAGQDCVRALKRHKEERLRSPPTFVIVGDAATYPTFVIVGDAAEYIIARAQATRRTERHG